MSSFCTTGGGYGVHAPGQSPEELWVPASKISSSLDVVRVLSTIPVRTLEDANVLGKREEGNPGLGGAKTGMAISTRSLIGSLDVFLLLLTCAPSLIHSYTLPRDHILGKDGIESARMTLAHQNVKAFLHPAAPSPCQ